MNLLRINKEVHSIYWIHNFLSVIMHEVKPVKKGIRRALVSWVQGPNLR